MSYFYIEPEVAGGIGDATVLDTSVHPPLVSKLTFEFETFPLDAIVAGFPAYIVTDSAQEALLRIGVTGANFAHVDIVTSATFDELNAEFHPKASLPTFSWLKVGGKAGEDDFGIARDNRLVVSEQVLQLLAQQGIENALVEPFDA